jgi:arylsulfatase A-like enzyme
MHATEHGVWSNSRPIDPARHPETLAPLFRSAGYHTGYVGKWHMDGTCWGQSQAVPAGKRLGYQHWRAANVFEFCSQPYDCVLYDENDAPVKLPGYRVDAVVDEAIRYIEAHRDEPFFLFVSILEPHHQNEKFDYVPPDGYRERYAGRWLPPDLGALRGNAHRHAGGYFGCVKRCDEAFGRLLDALASLGLRGRTNVLYTADHGCHFGTRTGMDKRSCHESSVRIPCALSGPDFDGGGTIDQPVSLIDLPPTLLRAAGIDVPASFRGTPLQELMSLPPGDRPETEASIQITDDTAGRVGRALRTRKWKYAITSEEGAENGDGTAAKYLESHLYDLEHDPYELLNLVQDDAHREVRERFRVRLAERMREIGEPDCTIETVAAAAGGRRPSRY